MASKPKLSLILPEKDSYTIPEAAIRMSTNEWFVRKMLHENKLKFLTGGKEFLIPHWAIQEFLKNEAKFYKDHEAA